MRSRLMALLAFLATFGALLLLHGPLLRLPYFWDEAGYYIPAALDFYRAGLLIPKSTLPTGHTPLVMVYLALAWRVLGFSPLVTRAAMTLIAAATVATLYVLGRRVASREAAAWSALLLAVMPLFFAQSSLAHLDLAAALFTLLAFVVLLEQRYWTFALVASLAVLSKETAVVLLPVAWALAWRRTRASRAVPRKHWLALLAPLVPLLGWSAYYHHATGFWTGNREYLAYNLYSTLLPARILWTLMRRLYEAFVGGFNWLLMAGALAGALWVRWRRASSSGFNRDKAGSLERGFFLLTGSLTAIYLAMLSSVGGAILPRYLLPVFPPLILAAVIFLLRLPRWLCRPILLAVAGCFVWAWFINPPGPFPFEDNVSYADFIRLHQQAAAYLEGQPSRPRILTAWPASDELTNPDLGYVTSPVEVVRLEGFEADDFAPVDAKSFDLLYLYSRKWEPADNWMTRSEWLRRIGRQYFGYSTQVADRVLIERYHLRLVSQCERRGQWVRIYSR